jgi:nucleotide-binding universal stress UspA family protein
MILGQVARILRREDSEIILLRVLDITEAIWTMEPGERVDTERFRDEEREKAQKYLHGLALHFSASGGKVHARIADGPVPEAILEQAETEGATMIAMSTHGRSGVSRWVLGSVAEKVVRQSPVPVLLVRSFRETSRGDFGPATSEELPFRKILVPVDGSRASEAVVRSAEKFAQLCDSEIQILHVEPLQAYPDASEVYASVPAAPTLSDEDPATARSAERFESAGLRARRLTVVGDPAGEIIDRSHAAGIDLIAMATHGRSGFSRVFLGSVAERVLRGARIPLLLVRSPEASTIEGSGSSECD